MAQSFQSTSGLLIIPGAYPSLQVQQSNSGLATSGVLMLVGEADAGPGFTLETDLDANRFGPDQAADVIAKYKSGNLVDAYLAACAPANDDQIQGAPSRIVLVKTNPSTKASGNLLKFDTTTYAVLADKSYGQLGNLINWQVTAAASEVIPTTGAYTMLVPSNAFDIALRANGGTRHPLTVAANTLPPAFVTAVDGLADVAASGGAERGGVNGILGPAPAGNISITVISGFQVRVDETVAWVTTPVVGDTMYIPVGSTIAGGSNQNCGSYVVTSATSTTIFATKLRDATGAPGANTAPVTVGAAADAPNDVRAFAPVTITLETADPIDGVGKALEIAELTTNTDVFSNYAYQLNTTPVTWISKASTPTLLTSGAEYRADLHVNRQLDNVQEELVVGGEIALTVGYLGTTASMTITATTLTTTVTGGAGTNLSINLADFPTIADLATFISSQAGYSAAPGTTTLGQQPSTALDRMTTTLCGEWATRPGRIKIDAFRFFNKVSEDSLLVQLGTGTPARAAAGLPAPTASLAFLSGGAKGATTLANFLAAIDACEGVRGNFLVPLISRDATADIADNLTDPSSTYTIDSVNAYCRTHVLKMSTLKRRRNRQAFLSKRDTFANQKTAAANIASSRCSMTFQDVRVAVSSAGIRQYQPWMAANLAAAMQAAGFYRPITFKGINISGAIQAAGDYNPLVDSNVEDAILSGLLPIKAADTGGFIWVVDQTTYSKDANFVFNSVQAMYIADIIALTTAQRMEKMFVGQSLADISAAIAVTALEGILNDFFRLKLIGASDDAPKGFKNIVIRINGPVMLVSLEVKLATELLFIPISFLLSEIQQTATG